LLFALVFGAVAIVEAAPGPGGVVAAVYPPWWPASRIAAAAASAGRIVAGGGAAFVITLKSDEPGLADRARANGAWLVLGPNLRGLCGASGGGGR
jgi:hypothetical protein